jgi:uncharacterized membrane protein
VDSLIAPNQDWLLWALLLGVTAFGLWAERFAWGRRLTGYVICIAGGALLSNLYIVPVSAPAYDVVWGYLVPLAIPLLLFRADLRRIVKESGPLLIATALGTVGTVLGTLVAFYLIPMGEEGWKLVAPFSATYIGGSMNYAAASEAIGLRDGTLLTAGVAADNVLTAIFLLVLFALPALKIFERLYKRRADLDSVEETENEEASTETYWKARPVTLNDLAQSLAVGVGICALGYGLAPWVEAVTPLAGAGMLVITAIAVTAASLFPRWLGSLSGGEVLGTYLMHVFFVAVGASANIPQVLAVGPVLFLYAATILTVHLAFILVAGWCCRLDIREIVTASNANVGGPATAVALAVARRWDPLIIPAVLCGTLGYAAGTFIGVGLANWLR